MPSFQFFFLRIILKCFPLNRQKRGCQHCHVAVNEFKARRWLAMMVKWKRCRFCRWLGRRGNDYRNTPSISPKCEKIMCYFIQVTKNVQWSVILVIFYILLLTVNNKKGSQNRPQIKSSNYFQHCRTSHIVGVQFTNLQIWLQATS